jgi:hypothetical protein
MTALLADVTLDLFPGAEAPRPQVHAYAAARRSGGSRMMASP